MTNTTSGLLVGRRTRARRRAIMVISMVMTKTIMSAAEFKAKCLDVLDQVADSGQGIVVTKTGK